MVCLCLNAPGCTVAVMVRRSLRRVAANGKRLPSRSAILAAVVAALAALIAALMPAGAVMASVPRSSADKASPPAGVAAAVSQCQGGAVCAVQRARIGLRLVAHTGGSGFTPLPGPIGTAEREHGFIAPQGKFHPPRTIGGPVALAGNLAAAGADGSARDPIGVSAGVVPKSFISTDLGIPALQGAPQEPTTAEGGNVVWYTGNDEVALSTDAGKTFTYFDPSTMLPNKGLQFCCDQVVSYSPQVKLFVWVMQYWCGVGTSSPPTTSCGTPGETSNRIRIAVASPKGLIAHAKSPGPAWTYWNITPNSFKGSLGGPGTWLDQSKLGVNKKSVNWSIDVLNGKKGVGAALVRFSLSELASRPKSLGFRYLLDPNLAMAVVQGLNTSMTYFAGNNDSLGQARIWSWPAGKNASFATLHVINHTTVPIFDAAVNGSDGVNWYSRWGILPGEVASATLAGTTLYLAQGSGRAYCTASCKSKKPKLNPVFSEPTVFISKYSVSSWKEVGERWLYDKKLALTWPSLATDGAGDVGIVLRVSAEKHNPQAIVSFLTPGSSNPYFFAEPEGLPQDFTGDYYSLRPGRTSESFVMTAQTVFKGGTIGNMHWDYIEWGRGKAP